MARVCTICSHPQREAIETTLVKGGSNRSIAKQFGVSPSAVLRHARDHLPEVVAAVRAIEPIEPPNRSTLVSAIAAEEQRGINVLAELERCFLRVNKLFDACDVWLTDPRDPTRYDIGPRAGDVDVVYEVRNEGGDLLDRKKVKLSWLYRAVERMARKPDYALKIVEGETKYADPRKLILDTASQLKGQLEFLIDAMERVRGMQEMDAFVEDVLTAIGEADSATRDRVIAALQHRQRLAAVTHTARRS